MKSINIARTIVTKRAEKGVTQDELASFMGVSRVSVSKWETGQTYPDIVLLPQLAAYFDISMDELMGYEPQMMDNDIKKLYMELTNEFATKPFDDVIDHCRDITKKYFSCFPLLFQIGILFMNYSPAANDEEKRVKTISEAKDLFIRVKTLCDNIELKHYALHAEALCELMLGKPNKVVVLLENEKINHNFFHPSISVMLSESYQMLGNIKEAKVTLQGSILDNIIGFFNNIPAYLNVCTDDVDHFEEVCKRVMAMIDTFNIKTVNPSAPLPFYLSAAGGYKTIGDMDKALSMLESYAETVSGITFPLKIKCDNFFTFIEDVWKDMSFGIINVPTDEKTIKQNMVNSVLLNPAFADFSNEPRYAKIIENLNKLMETTNEK